METQFIAVLDGKSFDEDVRDDLIIHDWYSENDMVAAHIGRWAGIVGLSVKVFRQSEAEYRHVRAKLVVDYLAKNDKAAEWKVMAGVRGDPRYLTASNVVAAAEGIMEQAKRVYEAFQAKSRALQTRSASDRVELEATTGTAPKDAYADDAKSGSNHDRMKAKLGGKKPPERKKG